MRSADILIIGTGSLASGIAYALGQAAKDSLHVSVIGRSPEKSSRMALIASGRAASFGTAATFSSFEIPEFKAAQFSRALRSLKPKVVLLAASLQSPWESSLGQNAWTKLVADGAFGITLPLQLALAAELCLGAADSEAAVVNACYPDCVNAVLHRLGLRVTCGVGNAAIVEAFWRAQNGAGSDVRVVGHHGHLSGWLKGKTSQEQPRIWMKGKEKNSARLRAGLGVVDEELNNVTSATATSVVLSLLTGGTLHTSIPGLDGLPGGYPFALKNRKFTLRLPSNIPPAEAIAHNKGGESLDGLDLDADAKFVGKARQSLLKVGFEYAQGFALADWQRVRDKMLQLRYRLRRKST